MARICTFVASLCALAACSMPPPANNAADARRQCFWAPQVTGFSDAGSDVALVRIGTRETWQLTLSPGCPAVDWAMRVGIRSRDGERICTAAPAELLIPDASESGYRSCLVRDVRRLAGGEADEAP